MKRYEAIDDLLGRLISFASLVHAENTTDPVRAKFYGDVQERITAASSHLLFFTLELNRIDDALIDALEAPTDDQRAGAGGEVLDQRLNQRPAARTHQEPGASERDRGSIDCRRPDAVHGNSRLRTVGIQLRSTDA